MHPVDEKRTKHIQVSLKDVDGSGRAEYPVN